MIIPVMDFNSTGGLLNMLAAGNVWGAVLGGMTIVLGSWFYILFVGLFSVVLMIRAKTIAIPAITLTAFIGLFYSYIPQEVVVIGMLLDTIFFAMALVYFFAGEGTTA